MKNIRFTQSINMSVTVEVQVPNDWSDENIHEFTKDFPVAIEVNGIDEPDVVVESISLDGAEITDAQLW